MKQFDLMKSPVRVASNTSGFPYVTLDVLGVQLRLHEDDSWLGNLVAQKINFAFAEWISHIETVCNESADQILADMCKDSLAYCTGYHKGADAMKKCVSLLINDAFSHISDLMQLHKAISNAIDEARKLVPAPNPDDEGFGRKSYQGNEQ